MSMGDNSARLSLSQLRQLQWLLGNLLVLISTGTVLFLEVEAWGYLAVTALVAVAMLLRPVLPSRVPRWGHRLAFPVILTLFAADLWFGGELLQSFIRLALLLLLYRSLGYRKRREDLQLVLLGLFLLVVAGVITVELVFVFQLLLFTCCALLLLLVATVTEAAAGSAANEAANEAPAWAVTPAWRHLFRCLRQATDWRLLALVAALFAGFVVVTAVLFVSIPRFQFENSLSLERFISRKARTGFSESVRFGQVVEIIQDNSLALSVDVPDPAQLPATPYFRMLVLDEYLPEGGFRLSSRLRQELTASERSTSLVRGSQRRALNERLPWVFYLEAGVSRFLPLPGDFSQFRLKEPHPVQFSPRLKIAALRSEPVSMTAYRLEHPWTSPSMEDPDFALRLRRIGAELHGSKALETRMFLDLPAASSERELLADLLKRLGLSESSSPEQFARIASSRLSTSHGYSLSPRIPPGSGNPLLRWMASSESGHCELFAGSFVLLARAAGHPSRLVVGFRGGAWNAISNSLSVRNSDAHAWCEIWDGRGSWLRVDPTPGAPAFEEQGSQQGDVRETRLDRSWSARLNSLRVFWYRRIVNFDQRAQLEAVQGLRESMQALRRQSLDRLKGWLSTLKSKLSVPWTGRQVRGTLLFLACFAGLGWLVVRLLRRWRWRLRLPGVRGGHPVRREAGRWLKRLQKLPQDRMTNSLLSDLTRLRYGHPSTWPDPTSVFRQARKHRRRARLGARES